VDGGASYGSDGAKVHRDISRRISCDSDTEGEDGGA